MSERARPRHPSDLGLAQARELVQRAVDKAEQLGLRGAVAVVGASGTLLTASRMDAGGPGGMTRARSKAWISATQQIPSAEHLRRMTTIAPPVATGFAAASPRRCSPARAAYRSQIPTAWWWRASPPPARPSARSSRPTSTRARSAPTVGPPTRRTCSSPTRSASPTEGQHGDDGKRWELRFGDLTVDPADSLGLAAAPPARRQAELDWARTLCDAAMREAARRGVTVAVAVVDRGGDPIQQDLMDGGPSAAPAIAQATAAAAALFGCESGDLGQRFGPPKPSPP